METSLVVIRDGKGEKMNRQNTKDIQDSENTLYDIILFYMLLYIYSDQQSGLDQKQIIMQIVLLMIMMCQCKFIIDKNRITLIDDVNNGRDCVWGQEVDWESQYLPLNFVVELKLVYKNKVLEF